MHVSDEVWTHILFVQPKFLSKEERAAEAIKKRQQEAEGIRQRMEDEKKRRADFGKEATKAFDDVRKMDKDQDRDKDSFR